MDAGVASFTTRSLIFRKVKSILSEIEEIWQSGHSNSVSVKFSAYWRRVQNHWKLLLPVKPPSLSALSEAADPSLIQILYCSWCEISLCYFVKQDVLSPAAQSTEEEEEEDEESHFSEGQLVPASSQSDDSEISEDIVEGKEILIQSNQ